MLILNMYLPFTFYTIFIPMWLLETLSSIHQSHDCWPPDQLYDNNVLYKYQVKKHHHQGIPFSFLHIASPPSEATQTTLTSLVSMTTYDLHKDKTQ